MTPYLEGVTVRGSSAVNCSRCRHLTEDSVCTVFNKVRKRTVRYCRYFEPKEDQP